MLTVRRRPLCWDLYCNVWVQEPHMNLKAAIREDKKTIKNFMVFVGAVVCIGMVRSWPECVACGEPNEGHVAIMREGATFVALLLWNLLPLFIAYRVWNKVQFKPLGILKKVLLIASILALVGMPLVLFLIMIAAGPMKEDPWFVLGLFFFGFWELVCGVGLLIVFALLRTPKKEH